MNYNNMCPSSRNPMDKIFKKDEKVVADFVTEIVKKKKRTFTNVLKRLMHEIFPQL